MNKNDEYEVLIDGYNSEGQGVARVDGFVIFVPFAIKGERVRVHIIKVQKTFAVGKVVEILSPSKDRVSPKCPYFKRCGGCSLEHLEYEKACEAKHQIVSQTLARIGGFENINVENCFKSKKKYNYRNKFAFPIAINSEGKARVCMFRELSHDSVFIENCALADPLCSAVIKALEGFFDSLGDPKEYGFRHVVCRAFGGKLLVTIVSDKKPPPVGLFESLCELTGLDKTALGLFHCKKNIDNNVILEGELSHICGIECIAADVMGIKINISPMSFFQINDYIMENLYKRVIANFDENDVIIDAYSGAGLMSALLARHAKKVYAIEIVKAASRDAEVVRKENKIENLQNINGDAAKILPKLAKELKNFSLVLDPPRKGVDGEVISAIASALPEKIVYISCNPSSLARDLKLIAAAGYEICSVQPFDMFPQTPHVETLTVLKKLKS